MAKTAIHLEEEVQKKSIKGFLKGPEVPKDLIETVDSIPESPREIKPLELCEDKIEVDEIKVEAFVEAPPPPTKTPIQELVEKHARKPVPPLKDNTIIDNSDEETPIVTSENYTLGKAVS